MANKIRFLERTYLTIIVIIFLLIVLTPYLIRSGFAVIDEELAEIVCIILLFAVGYAVFFSYRKETTRNQNERIRLEQDKTALEDRLTEAFKYIGAVNIQIEQIRSVFTNIRKFPENKKDFGHILEFLAERTLSMVNADWLFFRIIDIRNLDSLGRAAFPVETPFFPSANSATGCSPQGKEFKDSRW